MLGDGIQAVGVIVAAIIIYFRPEWKIADPITTFVFAIIVLGTTVPVSIECVKILMEYSPSNFDTKELYEKIISVGLPNKEILLLHHTDKIFIVSI